MTYSELRIPPDPVGACPHAAGSPEKLAVLRLRASLRLPLFHPGDGRELARERPQAGRRAAPRRGVRAVRNLFQARLWRYGRYRSLGYFGTREEAEAALARARSLTS